MSENKLHLTQATLITADQVIPDSSLLIEQDQIVAINPIHVPANCQEVKLQGAYLMPGLIDLHGDGIEKMLEPRPGVLFPTEFALRAMDSQLLASGITTVYHAFSFAENELGVRNAAFAAEIVREIHALKSVLKLDTRAHCRYEITCASSLPHLQDLMDAQQVDLLSVMDHTPGQGQFKSDHSYAEYLIKSYQHTHASAMALIEEKKTVRDQVHSDLVQLVDQAKAAGVVVASHDDDSPQKVEYVQSLGVQISEFPLNISAAESAYQAGIATLFGAPNIVRGRSQSSGMRAMDAILGGHATCLCSDYMHTALLMAVFKIFKESILSLPAAVRLVTLNAANAVNDATIGEIAVGKKANLIAVRWDGQHPVVESTWLDGHCLHRL